MQYVNSKGELNTKRRNDGNTVLADVMEFQHTRKGKVIARLVSEDEEWYYVTLLNDVKGLVNNWDAGESLALRKSLCTSVHQHVS